MGRYELPAGQELAIPSAGVDGSVEGKPTKDPAFHLDALWIPAERAAFARSKATPWSTTSASWERISPKSSAATLTNCSAGRTRRTSVTAWLKTNPKVVEDLVPKMLSLSVIQRVLQNLLRERVPIRDSVTILEALSEGAQMTKNPVLLTEYVRQSIRRAIVSSHVNQQERTGRLYGGTGGRTRRGSSGGTQRAQQRSGSGAAGRPRYGRRASRASWKGRILRPWCW